MYLWHFLAMSPKQCPYLKKWGSENKVLLKTQSSSSFPFQLLFSIGTSSLLYHINLTHRDQPFLASADLTSLGHDLYFLFLFHMQR